MNAVVGAIVAFPATIASEVLECTRVCLRSVCGNGVSVSARACASVSASASARAQYVYV